MFSLVESGTCYTDRNISTVGLLRNDRRLWQSLPSDLHMIDCENDLTGKDSKDRLAVRFDFYIDLYKFLNVKTRHISQKLFIIFRIL